MIDQSFWSGKKVFITGNTGFKGSWLSLWLAQMGAKVYGYALSPPTQPNLYELCKLDRVIDTTLADIRDLSKLQKTINNIQPEIIIHMAAQPLVRESYRIPVETYAINVLGTVNLLESVRYCDSIRAVVNVTTDKVYENKEWCWGYREHDALGGYDPYSNSKACSELVTNAFRNSFFNPQNYMEHHVALASARAGNVIGGGDWAEERLVPDIIRAFLKGECIKIRNPHSIRPWQHVLEPLNGYLLLAQKLFESGVEFSDSWNFGPDDNDAKPVVWIVERLIELWGGEEIKYESDRAATHPHEANYLKLDCSKTKHSLQWYPVWNLSMALEKIVEWTKGYQNHEDIQTLCLKQIKSYMRCARGEIIT